MALSDRQKRIVKLLQEERKASVSDLAERFKVSEASIRLDLTVLENLDHVRRHHGGARAIKPSAYESRIGVNQQLKKRIARKALEYVQAGDTIFLDSGTTVLTFAQSLIEIEGLTIITNSIPIASLIGREHEATVILAGGTFNYPEQCCEGSMTEKFLDNFYAAKAFIGADAVDLDRGLFSNGVSMFGYVQKIIAHSKQTILLADSTKFNRVGAIKIGDPDCIDLIITDGGLSAPTREKIGSLGIRVDVV